MTTKVDAKLTKNLSSVAYSGSYDDLADKPTNLITDGDKGDITVSSGGSTWTINNGIITNDKIANTSIQAGKLANNSVTTDKITNSNVTLAKIQNINTNSLLGRYTTGTGTVQQISIGARLTLDSSGILSADSQSVTDGDKGDITVSGTGSVWTIDASAVTLAKIQNVNTNTLLGRTAGGAGDVQAISVTSNSLVGRGDSGGLGLMSLGNRLSFSGSTLNVSDAGLVKSDTSLVANSSPVNNTVIISYEDYMALSSYDDNTVYVIEDEEFTLDASDITGTLPVANGGTGLNTAPTNGQILIGNGTGYTQATITGGDGIEVTNASGSIQIDGVDGVPIGSLIISTLPDAPDGYLEADGTEVEELYVDYRNALIAAGYPYGQAGNGNPLRPNIDDKFIRFVLDGNAKDIGMVFDDQMQRITGSSDRAYGFNTPGAADTGALKGIEGGYPGRSSAGRATKSYILEFDSANSPNARTGTETYPKHIILKAYIKAFGAVNITGMADLSELLTAIATPTEAIEGISNTKLMTPYNTKAAIDAATEDNIISDTSVVSGSVQVNNIVGLTQAQYDAITTKDTNTLYLIME